MKKRILGYVGIGITILGGVVSSLLMKQEVHDEVEAQLKALEKSEEESEEEDYETN